jgi:hypothetical protein
LQYDDFVFCFAEHFSERSCILNVPLFNFLLANQLLISVALIVFGAFIAGARDLSFDARGYAIVFVANITTAVYLATINRIGNAPSFLPYILRIQTAQFSNRHLFVILGKSSGLNSFGLMWCNGIILITCTIVRFNFILNTP